MKIKIKQERTVSEIQELDVLKHATIPSFAGGSICSICLFDINEDNQIIFTVPYHSEYAHIKCFEEATRMRFTSRLSGN